MNTMTTSSFDYGALDASVRKDVQQAAERIRGEIKVTTQGVLNIGKELLGVKDKLPHGQWMKWLQAEFGMPQRSANKFMLMAKRFGKLEYYSNLPPSVLYELVDASDEAVQEVIEHAQAAAAAPKVTGKSTKVVTLATVREAKKRHPAPPKQKAHGRKGRTATVTSIRKPKEPVVKPPDPLERIALAHQLPANAFASRDAAGNESDRFSLWVLPRVAETAKKNMTATSTTVQEVLAEAVAAYAAPGPERKVRDLRSTLPKLTDIGSGAGIDFDGEYRHVRVGDTEARREEWLGEHFAAVVTAMRDFVAKVPANVSKEHAEKWLSHDPKNAMARQQKLSKARTAFVPLVEKVLAILKATS